MFVNCWASRSKIFRSYNDVTIIGEGLLFLGVYGLWAGLYRTTPVTWNLGFCGRTVGPSHLVDLYDMQEVLKTYSNRGVRMGIAHLGSKYIVINFTIACILEVLSHFRYMYMVQQVFVLKVWVISHSHILTNFWNTD